MVKRFPLCLICIALMLIALPAGAQEEDELTGCATDTWNAMTNQALLEARRENVMNQTFIRKPDSILMYACMEAMLRNTENNAGPIFSETDAWNNLDVDISGRSKHYQKSAQSRMEFTLGDSSLDAAITSAVKSAYNLPSSGFVQNMPNAPQTYASANFNHNYLGGASGIFADPFSANCNIMQRVWELSRCENFDDPKVFYTFEELMDEDPRDALPPGMACGDTSITQENIDIAQGKDVLRDDIVSHIDKILGEKGCTLTVNTGVTVSRRTVSGELQKFPDAVCTNAGCSYARQGGCQ